jgi:hypothetical protein
MDLQQEWQNMNAELESKDKQQHNWSVQLDAESHNLMQSLLFKLKWKLRWIRIINVPILIAALLTKGDLQIVLIMLFLSYEIAGVLGRYDFNKIKTGVDYSLTTKQVLVENYKAINRILTGEKIWGYLFLPLSGPIGLLIYKLTVDNNLKNVINSPNFVLLLCSLTLIGFPVMLLAQKMNNSLFSQHIKDLKEKINQLAE